MDPATPPADAVRHADPQTAGATPHDPARRAVVLGGLTGLALLATGCATTPRDRRAYVEPRPIYPPSHRYPHPTPAPQAAPRAAASAPTANASRQLAVIPRAAWTRAAVGRNVNRMNGVSRITVHHAGGKPVWFTDADSTYRMLESIRGGHRSQGWADIGYHFIIDRDGRVLEGRPIAYQGAHVSENNEHNVGVMMLGNFDKQRPSTRQTNALHATLNALAAAHRVPASRVYTHQELKPTACPGSVLQSHMVNARRRAALG